MEVNAAIIFMMLLVLMRTCMAIAFYPLAGKGQVQSLRLAAVRFFCFNLTTSLSLRVISD